MRPSANGPIRRLGVAAALLAVLGGCTGTGGPTASPASQSMPASAAPSPSATPVPTAVLPEVRLDEELELADGRTLTARCVGSGTPTILLEVGGSGDMRDWARPFVNELGLATTTCLYSRAGGPGSSPPKQRPPTMDDITSDAYELLELAKAKAGVQGPYVFVGWSLGGSVALANALARPDQTVGVAILDTDFPVDFLPACEAAGRTVEDCQAEFDMDIDAKFMESEIARAVHPLDLPAVLVTAMAYPDCVDLPSATLSANVGGTTVVAGDCAGLATAIADIQVTRWRAALPEIEQVRVDADHNGMIVAEGSRIAQLILEIVEAARAAS